MLFMPLYYNISSVGRGETTLEPRKDPELPSIWAEVKLPTLAVARQGAITFREMKAELDARRAPGPRKTCEAHAWLTVSPSDIATFLLFGMMVDIADVPYDLMEEISDVQTIASCFVRGHSDRTDWLQAFGIHASMSSKLSSSIEHKLEARKIHCVLREDVDRPEVAVELLDSLITAWHGLPGKLDMYTHLVSRALYHAYSDALVLANQFDNGTLAILIGLSTSDRLHAEEPGRADLLMKSEMHLALVYQQMGIEPDKQKEYTESAARYLRSHSYLRYSFSCFLNRRNRPPHTVAVALGPEWFHSRRDFSRFAERFTKHCTNCLADGPDVKLFRCALCRSVCYCSKACQKATWKQHKPYCQEIALAREMVQLFPNLPGLRLREEEGRRQHTIEKWHNSGHFPCLHGPMHAIGLQRDPSRGWTHILMQELEYIPNAIKDYRSHYRVVRCGVFLIKDVLTEIDEILEKEPGWTAEFVERHIGTMHRLKESVRSRCMPMFTLLYGRTFTAILKPVIGDRLHVDSLGYDPDWRMSMNEPNVEPPALLTLPSGARDVELVY